MTSILVSYNDYVRMLPYFFNCRHYDERLTPVLYFGDALSRDRSVAGVSAYVLLRFYEKHVHLGCEQTEQSYAGTQTYRHA